MKGSWTEAALSRTLSVTELGTTVVVPDPGTDRLRLTLSAGIAVLYRTRSTHCVAIKDAYELGLSQLISMVVAMPCISCLLSLAGI